MASTATASIVFVSASTRARTFARRAAVFALIGAMLYLALYVMAEGLVNRHAQRNRFHAIAGVPPSQFNYVILGASHAAVFDYRDMNARLQALTGARILNLSIVGGGVTPNRLLFDYFLTRHRTAAVVYVVDSFAFYSAQWNEERLRDRQLFVRAPFDPALAALLIRQPGAHWTALDYVTGFSKINNAERFAPDVSADEGGRFDRAYRPVRQVDAQRLAYLYPRQIEPGTVARYLGQFDALISTARQAGIDVIAIKPPLPDRVRRELPDEPAFDRAVSEILARHGAALHDFSAVIDDDAFFFDTDHLNRDGVLAFFESALAPLLRTR